MCKVAILETRGNLNSLINAFLEINVTPEVVRVNERWCEFSRLVVPGVGHIKDYSESLNNASFPSLFDDYVKNKQNRVLGICVGFQYFSRYSEEDVSAKCLSALPLDFVKLDNDNLIRIPHVGWNTLEFNNGRSFEHYFTHSYAATTNVNRVNSLVFQSSIFALTTYGSKFISFLRQGNIYGIQSHPEKSRIDGARFLNYFLNKTYHEKT